MHSRGVVGLFGVLLSCAMALFVAHGSASYSDRVHGNENLFAATAMVPPVNLVSSPAGGATASVLLAWNPGAMDFASNWQILRRLGSCSGWTPAPSDVIATVAGFPQSSVDSSALPGQVYCYAVRGAYHDWTSDPSSLIETSFAFGTLFPHLNGGTRQLRETPGTGSSPFGCLAVVLLVCVSWAPESYTFQSVNPVVLPAAGGWNVSLRVQNNNLLSLLGTTSLDLQLWYVTAGACGDPPDGHTRIAGSTINLGAVLLDALGLLGTGTTDVTANLNGNAGFIPPVDPSFLCLRVAFSATGLLSLLNTTSILHGSNTWIQGPMP